MCALRKPRRGKEGEEEQENERTSQIIEFIDNNMEWGADVIRRLHLSRFRLLKIFLGTDVMWRASRMLGLLHGRRRATISF